MCRPCHHSPHKSLAPQERVPRSPAQLGYCRRRCRQDQMGCNLNTATLTMNAQSPHKVVLVVSAVPRPSLQELGRRVRVGSSILVRHGNGAMSGVLSRVGASRRQGDNAAAQVRCWSLRCVVLCSNGVIVHLHVHLLVQGCQGSRKNRFVDIVGGLVLACVVMGLRRQISSGFSPGHAGPTTIATPPGYCSSWERMMRLLGNLLLSSSLGGTTTPPCRTERTPTLCVLGGDDSGTGAAWAAARLGVPTVLVLTVRARLASTACCVLWALVGVLSVHLQ